MKEIENGLHEYYGSTPVANGHAPIETEMKNISITHTVPFAKVTFVSPGSPADCAVSIHIRAFCVYLVVHDFKKH